MAPMKMLKRRVVVIVAAQGIQEIRKRLTGNFSRTLVPSKTQPCQIVRRRLFGF